MNRLHIPGPEHEPKEDYFGDVELGALICFLLAVSAFYAFGQQVPVRAERTQTLEERESAAAVKRLSKAAKKEREVAVRIDAMGASELGSRTWTNPELIAVVRFGKRDTIEAACRNQEKPLRSHSISDPLRLELLKLVDRREFRAPYTCLSHLYFDGGLKGYKDLHKELDEFWQEAISYEGDTRLIGSVVDDFRKTRKRPERPEFYNWLRACALNFDYPGANRCQQLLKTIAPQEGRDLIEVLQKQLVATQERPEDLPFMIQAMGVVARQGQPRGFRVNETKQLPDYDVDFRQGALFMLCRFLFSPDRETAVLAAEELADLSRYGARAFDKHLMARWRYTCFDGFNKAEDDAAVKILAVWDGKPESKPVYALQSEIDNGRCQVDEGFPMWHCGARAWNGEGKPLPDALADFFVETRDIETSTWEY